MGAYVKVFALSCIDPRFRDPFERFLQNKFQVKPTEYDLKTDAGATKEIALKTPIGEWILKNADIAYTKHGARIFVICNHMDCAYYGGASSFSRTEDESHSHAIDLMEAARILSERLKDIQLFAYIVYKEQRQQETFVFQQVAF